MKIFRTFSFLFFLTITASYSEELPCFSAPVREDNAWQNWYADNKCGGNVTVHYTEKDADGRVSKGTAFAGKCQRTQIIQTFKNSEITGFSWEWNQPIPFSCSDSGSDTADQPKRSQLSAALEDARKHAAQKQDDAEKNSAANDEAIRTGEAKNLAKYNVESESREIQRSRESNLCVQNELDCNASNSAQLSRIRTGQVYRKGYVSENLVSSLENNMSSYCTGIGQLCRSDVLRKVDDIMDAAREPAVEKINTAVGNIHSLSSTLDARYDAYRSDVRRRQAAMESERASAEALEAFSSFMTGFAQSFTSVSPSDSFRPAYRSARPNGCVAVRGNGLCE